MLSFLRFRPTSLAGGAIKWTFVRSVAGVSSSVGTNNKLMVEFDEYLDGTRSKETIFGIMKHCATGLETERPHTKVSLANHVYTSMKEKGHSFDTRLYNSLLQVYLANRHSFSPVDILSNMREEGLVPNRGTMTLLLKGYCQEGNMTGAKQILKELKARDMTISEDVYAALISGHAQEGNMDAARQIIQIMKNGILPPGLLSYSALLSGYAYHADFDSIKELIATMKEEGTFVPYGIFIDMVDSLSRSGQPQKIPELLDMIHNKDWVYNEFLQKAAEMSVKGEGESSIHILKCLIKLNFVGERQRNLRIVCCNVLRNMVLTDKPLYVIQSCVSSLLESDIISSQKIYEEILKATYTSEKWSDGRTVLLKMHELGLNIELIHLYPPIAATVKNGNIKDHFDWLSFLTSDLQLVPDTRVCDYTIKALKPEEKDILQYMKDENIELNKNFVFLMVGILCFHHQYNTLYTTLKEIDTSLIPANEVLDKITRSIKLDRPNLEMLCNFFSLLAPMVVDDVKIYNKSVYFATLALSQTSQPNTDAYLFVKALLDKKLVTDLRSDTCNQVLISLNHRELIDQFFEFLQLMSSHGVEINAHHNRQIVKMAATTESPRQAQLALSKLKRDENGVIDWSVSSELILTLAQGKKPDLAIEHYEKLMESKPDYNLSLITYSHLIQAYANRGDMKSAMGIKSKLMNDGFKPSRFVFNALMNGYAKIGDIKSVQAEFDQMISTDVTPNIYSYHKLMESYAYHKDVDNVRRVLKEIESNGAIVNSEVVVTLVGVCLSVGDLQSALGYLDHYSTVIDAKSTLNAFVEFINESVKQNNTELTDRVVDIMKRMKVSENAINHRIVFALLRCGRNDEAIAFVRKVRLEISMGFVTMFSRSLKTSGNVECIQSVMSFLREFKIKPYSLHIALIKAYAANNDVQSLLSVTKELQSHGETQSQLFRTVLASLLKQHNVEESPAAKSDIDNLIGATGN